MCAFPSRNLLSHLGLLCCSLAPGLLAGFAWCADAGVAFIDRIDPERGIVAGRPVVCDSAPASKAPLLLVRPAKSDSALVPLLIVGPPSRCVDVVFYPGPPYAEWGPGSEYASDVDLQIQAALAFDQMSENADRLNFYRLDVASVVDECRVYYEMPVCNSAEVTAHVIANFPEWGSAGHDQIVVLFNYPYPEIRYARAEPQMIYTVGWRPSVIVHEFGHSFARLGDEYDLDVVQPLGCPPYANLAGPEAGCTCPDKWGHLMHLPGVGCWPGAMGWNWYRSTYDMCIMRYAYKAQWCPICSETVQREFDRVLVAVPIPSSPAALDVFPNPLNPRATIVVQAEVASVYGITVYDLRGRLVAKVHEGWLPRGRSSLAWNGRDCRGMSVPSGHYCVMLRGGGAELCRRVSVVR